MSSLPKLRTLPKPALTLLLLSPITGEMLTGSAPPAVFFSPVGLFILIGLYGCGALLVREYSRRWGKGWACIVLLGVAYGIIEEGLTAKSFFDPNWMDLGILGTYGRWLDVNWVWSQGLSIYHAVVSITAPIILMQLTYPVSSGARWLGRKAFIGAHVWFFAVVAFSFAFITDFYPNIVQVAGCVLAVAILAYAAKNRNPKVGSASRGVGAKWLYLLSLFMMITFFPLIYWVGPYVVQSPIVLFAMGLAACGAYAWAYLKRGGGKLSESQLLGVAGGILTPWVILTPIQEFFVQNPDSTVGMTVVGILYAGFLVALAIRVRRGRSKPLDENAAENALRRPRQSGYFCRSGTR